VAADDFAQFVRWRCQIERGATLDAVLKEAGFTQVQWAAVERRWLRRLAQEAERGGGPLTRAYADAFGPLVDAAVASTHPPAQQHVAPEIPPSPVVRASVASAPAPEMTAVGAVAPVQDTPFDSKSARVPASAADDVAREAEAMVGDTGIVSDLAIEDVLPFPRPGAAPAESSIDETAHVDALMIDAEPLPFEKTDRSAPTPVAPEIEREGAQLAGGTAFVTALSDDAFATTLTLEQYASLRADLDREGADRAAVLERYQVLDEDHFVAIKRHWSDAFRVEPAAYGRFRAAYDAYNRWLEGG
jgi:hypothetical protein